MEKIRLAGIIPMEDGLALMYRKNVKNRDISEYYVFPGGGREGEETFEQGTKREIKEELGIEVEIVKKLYEFYSEKFKQKEIFYLCQYKSGEFGTGNGPEFKDNPKYVASGKYEPKIIKWKKIKNIPLMPIEIKEKLLLDIENDVFKLK